MRKCPLFDSINKKLLNTLFTHSFRKINRANFKPMCIAAQSFTSIPVLPLRDYILLY